MVCFGELLQYCKVTGQSEKAERIMKHCLDFFIGENLYTPEEMGKLDANTVADIFNTFNNILEQTLITIQQSQHPDTTLELINYVSNLENHGYTVRVNRQYIPQT